MDQRDLLIIFLSIIVCVLIVSVAAVYVTLNDNNKEEVKTTNITVHNNTPSLEDNYVSSSKEAEVKKSAVEKEETPLEKLRRENAELDAIQICPNCGVYTGLEGKYCEPCYTELTGGAEYKGGFSLPDK